MEKIWEKVNTNLQPQKIFELSKALQILPITAQILISRGIIEIDDAKKFITPTLNDFHNPFLMKDMDKSIERIKQAVDKREKILIYGDYDVDGMTATALLMHALAPYTSNLIYYLPHRIEEGYGVSKKGIDFAQREGVQLIITVDCGISAIEEVEYANASGIDVIVTDHHEVKEKLPPAFAIINPKQLECPYPDKNLAGVGVVVKLVQGLMKKGYCNIDLNTLLEFACLGTVADIVPITGENRIIVKYGLIQLERTQNIGLKALIKVCGLEDKKLNTWEVGFKIAPRINAMGRLEDGRLVIELLLTQSQQEAEKIANILNEHNRKRQGIQEIILQEAIESTKDEQNKNVIVIASDNWHPGVIGIVASKIVDKYYRPTIIISLQNGLGKGSGRSIPNFHLLNAIKYCKDLLESYGGHEQAVGLTILPDKIDEFRQRINEYVQKNLQKTNFTPSLQVFEVSLKDINCQLINEIEDLLAPFGRGNPRPVFSTTSLDVLGVPMIVGNNHLKMKVQDSSALILDTIGFNMGDRLNSIKNSASIDLSYTPQINIWQNRESVQLNIKDIKVNCLKKLGDRSKE